MLYTKMHIFNVYTGRAGGSPTLTIANVTLKWELVLGCHVSWKRRGKCRFKLGVLYHLSDFPKDHVAVMNAVSTTFLVLVLSHCHDLGLKVRTGRISSAFKS